MKKIINNPDNVVSEMLEGMEKAHPELEYIKDFEVIVRKNLKNKVGIISGGGSGHEPSHAGYVGEGMLDAAVAGNVFASPSPDRILEAIKKVDQGKGVLLVIKNYSGDIMNFEMAKDLAEMEGIDVDSVVVNDDIAIEESEGSTGRRGIAGTILIHKIAGAKAEEGASLNEVKRTANKAIDNLRSMGMAMTSCILPGVGKPGFHLKDDEIEIGMGIHGEPGVKKSKILNAKELAEELTNRILDDMDFDDSEVVLMINGLCSTPLMELYILNNEVEKILKEKNIKIYKTLVGDYMTALEMAGASVTLLKLDEELKEMIDAPCNTPALKG